MILAHVEVVRNISSAMVARVIYIFLLCLSGSIMVEAQISAPASLDAAMNRYEQYRKDKEEYPVYRISVLITRDRREMEAERSRFRRTFPEDELKWSYDQPYYSLKTGYYLLERESWADLLRIRRMYPNAILSIDRMTAEEYLEGRGI